MELHDYWRILVRRGWIIVLVTVIGAASAYFWSKAQVPVYRSTVYINVRPARLDWGLQQTIKQVMRNYARQIKSISMAQRVAEEHQLDLSPYALAEKITVSPIESDLLLQIDVKDTDPVVAAEIANSVAEEFVAEIEVFNTQQRQEDRVAVSILDYAQPGTLFTPRTRINTVAGALLGAVVGGLIVLVLEFLDDTIKTTDDVKRHVGADLMVLGTIPPAPEEPTFPVRQPGAGRRLLLLRR